MPYWLESDTFADDQIWDVLAGGNADRIDRLQAAYARLKSKAAHQTTDGYLTEATALRYARASRATLDRLALPVLGRPPRLHRPGDECPCLGDSWVDGYDYRIHAFLRRNPSRSEYLRNRTQRAELRDAALRTRVHARDGGCCRYCRSGPLSPKAGRARDRRKALQYDHVDPDQTGEDNFVVACGRCNEHKGRRTPYEADMVLLPVPTPAEAIRWRGEPLTLLDADQEQNHRRITDESKTEQQHDVDPITDSGLDSVPDPDSHPNNNSTGSVCPDNVEQRAEQHQYRAGEGAGMGRVGEPASDPQPVRPSEAPDVYTRRSRPPGGGTPPFRWPPGSVPATPRPEDEP